MNDTRFPLPDSEETSSELERLRAAVHRAEQAERLQRALFAISELSSSDLEMPHMLQQLHAIVGSLMYARNLFMALYDEASDSLDFIYMVDEATPDLHQSGQRIAMADYAQALTWYLVRDGLPRRGSMQALAQQVPGPLRARGANAQDWLGVPLREGSHVRGALVVQSYDEPNRYGPEEQALLEFVASHVLTAVQRKQSQQALEQAVQVSTAELARANQALVAEVTRRQRGERRALAVAPLVRQTLQLLRPTLPSSISVQAQGIEAGRRQHPPRDVMAVTREVTDLALRVEQGRFFAARLADSKQSHRLSPQLSAADCIDASDYHPINYLSLVIT